MSCYFMYIPYEIAYYLAGGEWGVASWTPLEHFVCTIHEQHSEVKGS